MESRTTYFVDFENVNTKGLDGLNGLDESCLVYIFYSNACPKLPIGALVNNCSRIKAVETAPGKQALDIQLSTYLGYTLEKESGNLFIVSNDTDFDKIIEFWAKQGHKNIYRIPCIGACTGDPEQIERNDELSTVTLKNPELQDWIKSIINLYAGNKNRKSLIHGELSKRFGQTMGRNLYLAIREEIL